MLAGLVTWGFRALAPAYPGGDLLYHGALALGLLRSGLPLQGPYTGLPAYYPPGYHLLLAVPMAILGADPLGASTVLFLLLVPVLPIGTYLLAGRLTGRPWVAVLAVALTLFAGGYNLNPLRAWVNSLFMGGQLFWPAYPRDLVFAVLPFAAYAFLRALSTPRVRPAVAWGLAGGCLLGLSGLVQIQLLLPLPVAFGAAAVAVAVRDPGRRRAALVALGACGIAALLLVAPWIAETVHDIRVSGGVALDNSDQLEPARFAFWSYPREFGLLLPLGVLGAGVHLLFLRRPDGPRPGGEPGPWRPSPVEGGVLAVTWWIVPFALGILYNPGWPLEDALRPQRLWLIASQPLAILAAMGLAASAEHVLLRRRPSLVVPAILGVTLLAVIPATAASALTLDRAWTRDVYGPLDRVADRVPAFDTLLGWGGEGGTVLAPEGWSPLVWFDTGRQVVGLLPPGYAKLAFDPATFTGASQAQRRAAQVEAWSGDGARLLAVAHRFAADRIVVPRDGDRWALLDVAAGAVLAADPGAGRGAELVAGNGWDAVRLDTGERLVLPAGPAGPVGVDVTLSTPHGESPAIALVAVDGAGGTRILAAPALAQPGLFPHASAEVSLEPGERLAIEARSGTADIQAVRGWLPPPVIPAGWRIGAQTQEAVVLEPAP